MRVMLEAVRRALGVAKRPGAAPKARGGAGWALRAALAFAVVVASGLALFVAEDRDGKTARLSADAKYYHAYLPSLFLDRDLDFTRQYEVTKNWYGFDETDAGRPGNVFGIGPAVFSSPLFLVGHAWARATGEDADGFSDPEVLAALSASWLASLGALIPIAILIRRRLGGDLRAWAIPVLLAAAGPVIYYAIKQPGYAHPFATLFAALLVERWDASFRGGDAGPRPLRTWLILGALLGASALARPQCALWAVILAWAAADDILRARRLEPESWPRALGRAAREAAPRWLAGAAAAVLVFSPQLLAWKAIYGAYYTVPQGEGFMWWAEPAWSEVLFSSRNGLLPWAPAYALAAAGLAAALWRTPRVASALAAGVALQVVANGAVWDWWAGGSFGGRRFDSTFVAFAYGLAALAIPAAGARARARARAAAARALASFVWVVAAALAVANLVLVGQYSERSVRMRGGDSASAIIAERVPGPLGTAAAAASSAASAPARWAFAWRHGVDTRVYDRVVGVHYLGELYPGLNRIRGATREDVPLGAREPHVADVRGDCRWCQDGPWPSCSGCVVVGADPARILVGLNRRDPIRFEAVVAPPPGRSRAEVVLRLEGEEIGRGEVGAAPTVITGGVARAGRGVNRLDVQAPAGAEIRRLRLLGTPDPRGR